MRRMLRASVALATVLALAGCAGLPTSGPVWTGRGVADAQSGIDLIPTANGPIVGAGPDLIVAGFLEAAIAPADGWRVAREFLSAELAETWNPAAGVTIDRSASTREPVSDIADPDEEDAGSVVVDLDQVASVDAAGTYTEATGQTDVVFELERAEGGEWRISAAPDGVVLDVTSFQQVFSPHALQFYDLSWSRLVPDLRWYPKRSTVATRIARAVVEDGPTEWLGIAVQNAFPADISLGRASVPIEGQVAEVELDRAALALDETALSRMRTQLQASLQSIGVSEVRFVVDGRVLDAGIAPLEAPPSENGAIVLTSDDFGELFAGELTTIPGISERVTGLGRPVVAIDVAQGDEFAAVQDAGGAVWVVSENRADEIDLRPGLIRPTIDPWGYIWTVPKSSPQQVHAFTTGVTETEVETAWPDASAITHLRVSSDGTRVAAALAVGDHRSIVVAAVVRDGDGEPQAIGPTRTIADVKNGVLDLSWSGSDSIVALLDGDNPRVLTQPIGGPGALIAAPTGAMALAGSATRAGMRVLGTDGVLYAPRASVWQEYFDDVVVLGTRAGY